MATCQSCQKQVPDGVAHCPYCGAAMQAGPQVSETRTMFGYAPAPEELARLAQQAPQQAPSAPAPAPVAPTPAAPAPVAPTPSFAPATPSLAPTTPAAEGAPADTAMAQTLYAGGPAPAPGQAPMAQPPGAQPPAAQPPGMPSPFAASTSPGAPAPGAAAPAQAAAQPQAGAPGASFPATLAMSQADASAAGMTPGVEVPAHPATIAAPGAAAPAPAAPSFAPPAQSLAPQAPPPADAAPLQAQRNVDYGPIKGVSTVLWVILSAGMMVVSLALTTLGVVNMSAMHELLYFSWIPIIPGTVFYYILLYKAWAALQDGSTTPSAGAAVGFMFVPFFNIYWLFVAIGGYGSRFNQLADRQGLKCRVSEGTFVAAAVLMILFPLVGLPLAVIGWCGAINKLAKATRS